MPNPSQYSVAYAEALNLKFEDDDYKYAYHVEPGRRFDRIVGVHVEGHHGSVHAFVERTTGLLVKPATWSTPQKNPVTGELFAPYNLSTQEGFEEAVEHANYSGSYLYSNYNKKDKRRL